MDDIQVDLKEQSGGWYNVSIITLEELIQCPDFLTNQNTSQIIIASSITTTEILPVGESINITSRPLKTKSGIVYNIKGVFDIAYQSAVLDTYLNKFNQKKVVLRGIKHDGEIKLYGSKKFPLMFSYQFIDGKNYEEGVKVRVTVSGRIPQKPVFISN